MNEEVSKETIEGTVEDIKYRNETNGYTVLEIGCDDTLITAVGIFADVSVGETVKLSGSWTFHSTFGRQFKAETCERNMPKTTEQLYSYLAAGAVKGIGPATAEKIIGEFGERAFEILDSKPEKLATIKGISLEKAQMMCAEYKKQFAIRNIMMSLETYGMSPNECIKAYRAFGAKAVEKVLENPYDLCTASVGIGFERAEKIASALPSSPADSYRIKAGLLHILTHNLYSGGHTCLPRNKVIKIGAEYLNTNDDAVDILIDELTKENRVTCKQINGKEFVFLTTAYLDEKLISNRIKLLLKFPPPKRKTLYKEIELAEVQLNLNFADNQKEAIQTAVNRGMLILTGGPGTGKTTTLKGIISLLENEHLNIMLTAPTGRAAKRMTELTGYEAKTIHRLLEVEWDEFDRPVFQRNIKNPLECEALIVDELSMVDISVFASLLAALPFGCRLIMVGDSDQLPPVGAGNVLSDLIDSGLLPVVQLKEVFRQAMNSLIVTNAHRIVNGEQLVTDKKDSDFFFMERNNPVAAAETVAELYYKRLPQAYKLSPFTDIQVLCPSRKGELGTINLNRILQNLVNPAQEGKAELSTGFHLYRDGDKIMQIKNNYNIEWEKGEEKGQGVFNGDIGIIESIDTKSELVKVVFDDERTATYMKEQLIEVEHAYAITVHKSQGSEFRAVIMPVASVMPQLKYRNLLYTAVTRAKEKMIVVGNIDEVYEMAQNDRKAKRYSALKWMLLEDDT